MFVAPPPRCCPTFAIPYANTFPIGHVCSGRSCSVVSGGRHHSIHPKDLRCRLEALPALCHSILTLPFFCLPREGYTFVVFLGAEGLAPSTIKTYLAALRYFRILGNPSDTSLSSSAHVGRGGLILVENPAVTACGYPFAWITLKRWFSSSLMSSLVHTRSALDLRQYTTLVLTSGWWCNHK